MTEPGFTKTFGYRDWLSGSEIDPNDRGFCFPPLSVGPQGPFATVIYLYRRGRDFCEAQCPLNQLAKGFAVDIPLTRT
jgi:hypothetical protein